MAPTNSTNGKKSTKNKSTKSKPRGQYKQWLYDGNGSAVPKSTRQYRRSLQNNGEATRKKPIKRITSASKVKVASAASGHEGECSQQPVSRALSLTSEPVSFHCDDTEEMVQSTQLMDMTCQHSSAEEYLSGDLNETDNEEDNNLEDLWEMIPDGDDNDEINMQELVNEEEPFNDEDIDQTEPLNSSDDVNIFDFHFPDVDEVHEENDDPDNDSDEETLAVAPDLLLPREERVKMLLLLATKKRHKLTYAAAEDVMKLGGLLSEEKFDFKPSRAAMKNTIDLYSFKLVEHHVCPLCLKFIGVVSERQFQCSDCDKDFNTEENKKKGNLFLYLSVEDQIRALLEKVSGDLINPQHRKKVIQTNFEDIFDGALYKEKYSPDTITFNFFVDGLQVNTTSKQSAWPVLIVVNELPLNIRRKNVLMASVWLSKKKPKCNEYLKPFVSECERLGRTGVTYRWDGVLKTIKVKPFIGVSDSIARPLLRNSMQFNGQYGCGLCYHPGFRMRMGRGHTRSYSLRDGSFACRTHEELTAHAARAEALGETQKGIKGRSVLSALPGFDMVKCLDLDSFHAVVNVATRFTNLWFGSTGKRPFNISARLDEVDKRLVDITVTSEVSRAPRALKERSDYRGHEWFYFVIVYSIPILKDILKPKYLNHWSLFVKALTLLMQNSVAKSEIVYADRYLNEFVSQIDSLYGAQNVTFSVHLLTHLAQSTKDFAQPWCHSAFVFESYNNEIKNAVKSSNGAVYQVCKLTQMNVALQKMEDDLREELSDQQTTYLDAMLSRSKRLASPHIEFESIALLGKPKIVYPSVDVRNAISRAGEVIPATTPISVYQRGIINGIVFHGTSYTKTTRQNNCVALLESAAIFIIDSFVVVRECYVLGHFIEERRNFKLSNIDLPHYRILKESSEGTLRCLKPATILDKLIFFKVRLSSSNVLSVACVNVLKMEMLS